MGKIISILLSGLLGLSTLFLSSFISSYALADTPWPRGEESVNTLNRSTLYLCVEDENYDEEPAALVMITGNDNNAFSLESETQLLHFTWRNFDKDIHIQNKRHGFIFTDFFNAVVTQELIFSDPQYESIAQRDLLVIRFAGEDSADNPNRRNMFVSTQAACDLDDVKRHIYIRPAGLRVIRMQVIFYDTRPPLKPIDLPLPLSGNPLLPGTEVDLPQTNLPGVGSGLSPLAGEEEGDIQIDDPKEDEDTILNVDTVDSDAASAAGGCQLISGHNQVSHASLLFFGLSLLSFLSLLFFRFRHRV